MTRPNKHIWPKQSDPVKTFFGQKVVMSGPTIPPLTALFGEAVLFLNHCGCAGWSAPLLFAKPRTSIDAHNMFSER